MQLLRLGGPAGLTREPTLVDNQLHGDKIRGGGGQGEEPHDGDGPAGADGGLTKHEGLTDGHPPLDGDGREGQHRHVHRDFLKQRRVKGQKSRAGSHLVRRRDITPN